MSAQSVTTKFCQGISDISDSYMGFIIDQWGVLHDGHRPYEGVVECLKELKARKKHIIILSNSENPIMIERSNRRVYPIHTSDRFAGSTSYFDRFWNHLRSGDLAPEFLKRHLTKRQN